MPSLKDFLDAPSRLSNCHPVYMRRWFFRLQTMPETASGEMLLGSLQRRIGLAVATEQDVAKLGTELKNQLRKVRKVEGAQLDPRLLEAVLNRALEYPRTDSQRNRLHVLPLVPELANYTAAVRLRGSPWNPGNLLADIVVAGARDPAHARDLWQALYQALQIDDEDDMWARFLNQELQQWRTKGVKERVDNGSTNGGPRELPVPDYPAPNLGGDPSGFDAPAIQFVHDLEALLYLHPRLTRREWLGYLESLLRLGAVSHTQWLCRVHDVAWREVLSALTEGSSWNSEELRERTKRALSRPWWSVGQTFAASSRTLTQDYMRARYGLNLALYHMDQEQQGMTDELAEPTGLDGFVTLLKAMGGWASEHPEARVLREKLSSLVEAEPRIAQCDKGFTNNLREFWRYGLAKRQPQQPRDAEFDQGYWLQKRGEKRSPWVVMPGPVSLSLMAHCCIPRSSGAGTVADLVKHMALYGLNVQQADFEAGALAQRLRGLGLIVDSPDAESGMGLLDPLGEW